MLQFCETNMRIRSHGGFPFDMEAKKALQYRYTFCILFTIYDCTLRRFPAGQSPLVVGVSRMTRNGCSRLIPSWLTMLRAAQKSPWLIHRTNEHSGVRRSRPDLAYQHRHWVALGPAQFSLNVLSRSRYISCSYVMSTKNRKWVGGCLKNRAQRAV